MSDNAHFMTVAEYNRLVVNWTTKVRDVSVSIVSSNTHSSGKLQKHVSTRTRKKANEGYVSALGFQFYRYGVFRAYGAGRGYVVRDGVISRGYSAWSDEQLRGHMQKRGDKDKDIRKTVIHHPGFVKRTPLNWLDSPIEKNINDLADIAGEFHGDAALADILNQLNKITIRKNYGKR